MRFQSEKITESWAECLPLFRKNFEESGIRGATLEPNLAGYQELQNMDKLQWFTAKDSDGRIFGYAAFFITHNFHSNHILAYQDVFYVVPERRGIPAIRFFKFIDNELEHLNIDFIVRQSTPYSDWSRTLTRSGYFKQETVFFKKVVKDGRR